MKSRIVLLFWNIVSVPYRGATFLNYTMARYLGCEESFRPLSGSYISQYCLSDGYDDEENVSVPYRGATFLNNTYMASEIH